MPEVYQWQNETLILLHLISGHLLADMLWRPKVLCRHLKSLLFVARILTFDSSFCGSSSLVLRTQILAQCIWVLFFVSPLKSIKLLQKSPMVLMKVYNPAWRGIPNTLIHLYFEHYLRFHLLAGDHQFNVNHLPSQNQSLTLTLVASCHGGISMIEIVAQRRDFQTGCTFHLLLNHLSIMSWLGDVSRESLNLPTKLLFRKFELLATISIWSWSMKQLDLLPLMKDIDLA